MTCVVMAEMNHHISYFAMMIVMIVGKYIVWRKCCSEMFLAVDNGKMTWKGINMLVAYTLCF